MKRLVLAFGILVSVGVGAMPKAEIQRALDNCLGQGDKNACQALIDSGLFLSVGQCDKDTCVFAGAIYYQAGRYKEAIPYFEKAIALGGNVGYEMLGATYDNLQDYYNAKKYFEMGCNKGVSEVQGDNCYNLGLMYFHGKGARQDYHKAHELYKKACDMKNGEACNNLGVLYAKGQGVRQNLSTAKQYYGKACDLGKQLGCDSYKLLHNQGVQ